MVPIEQDAGVSPSALDRQFARGSDPLIVGRWRCVISPRKDGCPCDGSVFLTVFSHLEPVVVEKVTVDDDAVALAARTVTREVACGATTRPLTSCGPELHQEPLHSGRHLLLRELPYTFLAGDVRPVGRPSWLAPLGRPPSGVGERRLQHAGQGRFADTAHAVEDEDVVAGRLEVLRVEAGCADVLEVLGERSRDRLPLWLRSLQAVLARLS